MRLSRFVGVGRVSAAWRNRFGVSICAFAPFARLQFVVRIEKVDHVRDEVFGQGNIALRQQVSLFVLVAQELRR